MRPTITPETTAKVTSNDVETVMRILGDGTCLLVTGAHGLGKSHLLRGVRESCLRAGADVTLVTGSTVSAGVPLGAFIDVVTDAAGSEGSDGPVATVVRHFSRHRSSSVLLVDNADRLDEASLFVVAHLVRHGHFGIVLTVQDITTAPAALRELYDEGRFAPVAVIPLPPGEATVVAETVARGRFAPGTLDPLLAAADGNPLHLRELILGTRDVGRLVSTALGWELVGDPVATPRLAQSVGERFDSLEPDETAFAAVVALAAALPDHVVPAPVRSALVRDGLVEPERDGWIRIAHPLFEEALRARHPAGSWADAASRAVELLTKAERDGGPRAGALRRRRAALALEHGLDEDPEVMLDLARHALAASSERTARSAAEYVLATDPRHPEALRIAGTAASAMNDVPAADDLLERAQRHAPDDERFVTAAIARAQHVGATRHDPEGALAIVQDAFGRTHDPRLVAHLEHGALRWGMVAGAVREAGVVGVPDLVSDEAAAVGLVTAAMSTVVTGPLTDAWALLGRLDRLPADVRHSTPMVSLLAQLAGTMARSNTGDIVSTRAELTGLIERATTADALGTWEYTLGFTELLSTDAERAHALATDAVEHLQWRDPVGLLPAAQALVGATALVAGRSVESRAAFDAVPAAASGDPKVGMLDSWARAWHINAEGRTEQAAKTLVEGARALLATQHNYLAGMLAHSAARIGSELDAAADLLEHAYADAGGGLLHIMVEHVVALRSGDTRALARVADQLAELGMRGSAADSWTLLARIQERARHEEIDTRRSQFRADELRRTAGTMACWTAPRHTSLLLSEREYEVARLAAQRLTAKEIAELHGVSPNTVTNQLNSAFRKLGVRNRMQLRHVMAIPEL